MVNFYLPRELWLDVFRWATLSPQTLALHAFAYSPFQSESTSSWADKEVIATKCALVHVCREWRYLARFLLLEDIILANGGAMLKYALQLEGLSPDQSHEGSKSVWHIRRVCLPYSSCTPWHTDLKGAVDIMKLCPRLEVLVRPYRQHAEEMRFDICAEDCPSLTSLKRLDWWHYNDAARTGGFNSLPDVLRMAPNLQYLTLTGDLWLTLMHRESIVLPKLTVLRLRRLNVLFLQEICLWSLPSLRHILLDTYPSTPSQIEGLWQTFGDQIQVVELGKNLKFYVLDLITHILSHCRKLQDLNYYVQFTATPRPFEERHLHVTTVRLHAAPNEFVARGSVAFWEHVEEHVRAFQKPYFPALKNFVLHGDWKEYLRDPAFARMVAIIKSRDCSLEFAV
jgi:hypothetical protein